MRTSLDAHWIFIGAYLEYIMKRVLIELKWLIKLSCKPLIVWLSQSSQNFDKSNNQMIKFVIIRFLFLLVLEF